MGKIRIIKGKRYKNTYIKYSKRDAQKLRKRGFNVRKVTAFGSSRIYIRRK